MGAASPSLRMHPNIPHNFDSPNPLNSIVAVKLDFHSAIFI
jgi:hypothetical protein